MRKKRKRVILISLALLLFVFIITSFRKNLTASLYETISSLVCDEKRGKAILRELCNAYDEGEVAGNLCVDLCKKNQITIEQCLSHKNDNVIFSANWKRQKIILKAKRMSSHMAWSKIFPDGFYENITLLQKNFVTEVYNYITSQLFEFKGGMSGNNSLKLPPMTFVEQLHFNASVTSLAINEMKSLWMLLQQNEYYLMKLLKDFKHMPKVIGTCGQFYALEKVEILNEYIGVGLISAPVSWRVRVKLALQLLDLVQELDLKTVYGSGWQHCDVQPSNFGVNKEGIIMTIDIDMMYTNDKISEVLAQQVDNCTSHKDCEFFDCASLCDSNTHKCTAVRISNNLQVVCRDLFGLKWYEGGLLTSIPSRSKEVKLNKILNECSAVTNTPWTKRKYNRILQTLKRYLLEERNVYK